MNAFDLFAAAALQGILASEAYSPDHDEPRDYNTPEQAARRAWAMAEAMVHERSIKQMHDLQLQYAPTAKEIWRGQA